MGEQASAKKRIPRIKEKSASSVKPYAISYTYIPTAKMNNGMRRRANNVCLIHTHIRVRGIRDTHTHGVYDALSAIKVDGLH